jgi:hypothetical protein
MAAPRQDADGTQGLDYARLEWAGAVLFTLWTVWAHWLRFVHAGALWRDEVGAVQLANLPSLAAVFRMFPHEAFPLAVPMTIRLFTRIAGGSDTALRGLGLLIGLAITAGLWLNARLAGRGVPLLSMALLGGNAAIVVFGDEVRGYGLGSLCILASFIALARLLARPGPGAATAALLAVLVAAHCLLANAALIGALCAAAAVTAWWRGRRRVALVILGSGIAAGLSLLPYAAPLGAAVRTWDAVVTYPTSVHQIALTLWATLGPGAARWIWALAPVLALVAAWRLGVGRRRSRGPEGPERLEREVRHGAAAAAGAAETEQARGGAGGDATAAEEDVWRFSCLAILLAPAAQVTFLKLLSYTPRAWYFIPLLTLIAAAVEPLAAGWRREAAARPARLLLAALLAAVLLPAALPQLYLRMTNADLAAARLGAEAAAGDLVVVMPWYFGVSFNRYAAGPASWLTLPDIPDHRVHRYDLVKTRLAAAHPIADVLDDVHRTLAAGHRVWLAGELHFPPPGRPAPTLAPAPTPRNGWHDFLYNRTWSLQVGAYVRDHATAVRLIPIPAPDRISPLEEMSLVVASGWHDGP